MKKMVFNQTEYDSIVMALKGTTSKQSSQRLYTLIFYFDGYKQYEIAKLLKIDVHTVSIYIKKYKSGGISKLIEREYSPGTPTLLNPEQEGYLVKVITEHTPDEVGFPPSKNWNLRIIRELVKRIFAVEYSQSGMAAALHRLNLSYTRPTYTLKKADPEKQEQFMQDFEIVKKNSLMEK